MSLEQQIPVKRDISTPPILRAIEHATQLPELYREYKLPIDNYTFYSSETIGPIQDRKVNIPGAVFNVYEWRGKHGESLHITIREIIGDKPLQPGEPLPVRIDHGCLCMTEPLTGHDCRQQREMALDAMKQVGRGIMVEVEGMENESNGYGRLMVAIDQATNQKRIANGEEPLDLHQVFAVHGIEKFDVRKHPEVAALFSYKLAQLQKREIITEDNPLVLLGSSPNKIESITNGHNISVPHFARVWTGNENKSKEKEGYISPKGVDKPGVYLQYTDSLGQERYVDFIENFSYFSSALQKMHRQRKEQKTTSHVASEHPNQTQPLRRNASLPHE